MESRSFDYFGNAVEIFARFREEPYAFLLESSLEDSHLGRYSFIGFDPFDVFKCEHHRSDALARLHKKFSRFYTSCSSEGPPFCGGLMGYMSYDFGLAFENIARSSASSASVPEALFGFYDCIITIDHFACKLIVTSTGLPELQASSRTQRARRRMEAILEKLSVPENSPVFHPDIPPVSSDASSLSLTSNFTQESYCRAVEKALAYIRAGEIYQVNLSQRFSLDLTGICHPVDPYQLYLLLRKLSPSCFGGYFDCGTFQILSSSPERFIKVRDRCVETRPMKGTVPRGKDRRRDRQCKEELMRSEKDQAELLMITDLERNDLGRVCEYGTVRVRALRTLEEYQTVFQTTSTIEGRLQENYNCFEVLRRCFPGGSITGCPKIRAMQIIDELEPSARSIYTGSMGYISFDHNADFNVLIRTLLVHDRRITFQVGGGIVADSVPDNEYEETLVKAKALYECLCQAYGLKRGQPPFLLNKKES